MMALNFARLLGLSAAIIAPLTAASDSYILFGGGPSPDSSQVSIEQNVLWIDEILQKFGFNESHVLFGSGNTEALDVVLHTPNNSEITHWLPLARLYGKQDEARTQYRHNIVSRGENSASENNVSQLLEIKLQHLKADDSLLLIYSGHGSYEPKDVSKNALSLWNESHLDVNEFVHMLNAAPLNTTVRYVLPQCFSGAFARSILHNPAKLDLTNTATNRCGFFAVPENLVAEGCTESVNAGDYRDYSTYFIAALAGATRTGDKLISNPDLNNDGRVSLHEAHVYAYTEGFSTDIPRSTSDYYLELWEPWYTRWQSFVPLAADNAYWKMAQRLSSRLDIAANTPLGIGRLALQRRQKLAADIAKVKLAQDAERDQAEQLRKMLLQRFLREWPNATHPQSAAYIQFLRDQAESALKYVTTQAEYAKLAALQDAVSEHELKILELHRADAQYARVLRALRLAAIKENFDRLAEEDQRKNYSALTDCEAWSPPPPTIPAPESMPSR